MGILSAIAQYSSEQLVDYPTVENSLTLFIEVLVMNKAIVLITRILFGFMNLLYGLDGFLHFMPPYPMSDKGNALVSAMIDSGYLWPLMKAAETIAGFLLLADIYVPLALLILAPIVVNIFCLHLFINPPGIPIGILFAVLELILAWFYRDNFRGILIPKAVITESPQKSNQDIDTKVPSDA